MIRELKAQGVGIIYISHRLEELPQVADRVTAFRDGSLVGTRAMDEVNRADLIRMMVGREFSAVFPKIKVSRETSSCKSRGCAAGPRGSSDVSLSVRAGEILGLAGLVGAGRTELARTSSGLRPPTPARFCCRASPDH